MDAFRNLVDTFGIQPQTFSTLIIIDVILGSLLAARQLYRDFTSPPLDDEEERVEPITINLRKQKDQE